MPYRNPADKRRNNAAYYRTHRAQKIRQSRLYRLVNEKTHVLFSIGLDDVLMNDIWIENKNLEKIKL